MVWERGSQRLATDDRVVIKSNEGVTTLTIREVDREDQGQYVCCAMNHLGNTVQECQITLLGQFPAAANTNSRYQARSHFPAAANTNSRYQARSHFPAAANTNSRYQARSHKLQGVLGQRVLGHCCQTSKAGTTNV